MSYTKIEVTYMRLSQLSEGVNWDDDSLRYTYNFTHDTDTDLIKLVDRHTTLEMLDGYRVYLAFTYTRKEDAIKDTSETIDRLKAVPKAKTLDAISDAIDGHEQSTDWFAYSREANSLLAKLMKLYSKSAPLRNNFTKDQFSQIFSAAASQTTPDLAGLKRQLLAVVDELRQQNYTQEKELDAATDKLKDRRVRHRKLANGLLQQIRRQLGYRDVKNLLDIAAYDFVTQNKAKYSVVFFPESSSNVAKTLAGLVARGLGVPCHRGFKKIKTWGKPDGIWFDTNAYHEDTGKTATEDLRLSRWLRLRDIIADPVAFGITKIEPSLRKYFKNYHTIRTNIPDGQVLVVDDSVYSGSTFVSLLDEITTHRNGEGAADGFALIKIGV